MDEDPVAERQRFVEHSDVDVAAHARDVDPGEHRLIVGEADDLSGNRETHYMLLMRR